MRPVGLVNAERRAPERPPRSRDDADPHHGYWPGSAHDELERWRRRALRAEGELRRIRAEIAEAVRMRRGAAT